MATTLHPYQLVEYWINISLVLVTFGVELFAFVNCLVQRPDAFPAIGTFPKGLWLAMIGGSALFVLLGLSSAFGPLAGMLAIIPIVIALVYLLDVRPALRDAVDGGGPWCVNLDA